MRYFFVAETEVPNQQRKSPGRIQMKIKQFLAGQMPCPPDCGKSAVFGGEGSAVERSGLDLGFRWRCGGGANIGFFPGGKGEEKHPEECHATYHDGPVKKLG